MRLLTYDSNDDLRVTRDLSDSEVKPYAILSHTWGKDEEEVTFQEIGSPVSQQKLGYKKIEFCGKQARQDGRRDGWQHFWVDTCCIDKASHTELSKAITSMYRWYEQAQMCYVYLADVSSRSRKRKRSRNRVWESDFRQSRWFKRGWTLQELLAPRHVVFYSKEWERLGTKEELKGLLHEVTGIPTTALEGQPLSQFPIIERIRWTQGRRTKEKEDEAYCLLGIFGVHMYLDYGEGDDAFRRLQKELDAHSRAEFAYGQNPAQAVTTLQIDEVISESYSDGRLDVERLSGKRLPLDRCFINLSITHHSHDVDMRSTIRGLDREEDSDQEDSRQLSRFSLASRLNIQTPPLSDQVNLETLFQSRKQKDGTQSRPKRILIWGRAGMGKTTLCKKIVHDVYKRGLWKDLYDRVIWIPLRRLKRSQSQDVIQLLMSMFPCTGLGNGVAEVFRKLVDDKRTLFLLDGFDEVSTVLESDTPVQDVLRNLLSQAHMIITARPHTSHELASHLLDLELETIGFSQPQIDRYVQQVAQDASAIRSFIQRHPLVRSLAAIPVQLDAICYTWSTKSLPRDSVTMTSLYLAISKSLWKYSAFRLGKKTEGGSINKSQWDHQTWRETEALIQDEVAFLQELAFQGLCEETIEFDPEYVEKLQLIKEMPGNEIVHLVFLRTSDSSVEIGNRIFYFIHLTFQEFFAAQYFVSHWMSNVELLVGRAVIDGEEAAAQIESVMPVDFVHSRKYVDRYNIFWRFVVGLLQAQQHASHLYRFLDTLEDSPVDLIGISHQRLIVHCLSELHPGDGKLQTRIRSLEDRYVKWCLYQTRLLQSQNSNGWGTRSPLLLSEAECSDHILETLLTTRETEVETLRTLLDRPTISKRMLDAVTRKLQQNPTKGVQEYAIKIVGRFGNQDQVKVLDGFTPAQIATAWRSTLRLLEPAAMILIQLLQHLDSDVRRGAADALGSQATLPDAAVEALIQLLQDPDSGVRGSAANALGSQATLPDTAVKALIQLLQDPDSGVQGSAAYALGSQATLPDAAVEALIQLLQDPDSGVRGSAANALGSQATLPDAAVEALIQLLQDPDSGVRGRAAYALGSQATLPDTAVKALIQLLQHPDSGVQGSAAYALGSQATLPDAAVEALIQLLQDPDSGVRGSAANALGSQATLPDAAVKALIQLLQDRDRYVRGSAANALGSQATLPDAAVEALIQLLQDPGSGVRWSAADALGSQATLPDAAVEALIQLLRSSDYPTAEYVFGRMIPRTEMQSRVAHLGSSTLRHFVRHWFVMGSHACFIWRGNFCIASSGRVSQTRLQQHQLKQIEEQWQIARNSAGLPDLDPTQTHVI